MKKADLKLLLDDAVLRYNNADFIADDPIGIPHQYSTKQDIEITAFWTSMLAWGQRVTIINKMNELFALMDHAPHDFIVNHQEHDRKRFEHFKHRTFNYTDCLYFLHFLQYHYQQHHSLEEAFLINGKFNAKESIANFHDYFFSLTEAPHRTKKHVATTARNSSCKRMNMFLRWMVRSNATYVDFGIWRKIPKSKLMMPLDVHVQRVAIKLGLLKRDKADWRAVEELTKNLQKFDPEDPVKYDYALFGLGVNQEF